MVQSTPVQDPLINQIADSICRRRLHQAALIVLEAGLPLAFIGSQLLWLSQPALSLILPTQKIREVAELMEQPGSVAALISSIEERMD